jgi:carbonic anhydrase
MLVAARKTLSNFILDCVVFNTPSENNINGTSYPLEAHFVHATKDGKLAVVAVMFKDGGANPILDIINDIF